MQESYIRLSGLPWSATKSDIRDFLEGIRIEGDSCIMFTESTDGKRMDDCIIQLPNEDELQKALKFNRQYMGKRYIDVIPATSNEFYQAINRTKVQNEDNVLRLRGLPFESVVEDILKFFNGIELKESNVMVLKDERGKCTGEAYVEFNNTYDTETALMKHREKLGNRFIEIFQSSKNEMGFYSKNKATPLMSINKLKRPVSNRLPPEPVYNPLQMNSGSAVFEKYINFKNIPYECTEHDIVQFFMDFNVISVSMSFENNRFSGEADVFFVSDDEAHRAMRLDRRRIGKRLAELSLKTRKVYVVSQPISHPPAPFSDPVAEPPYKRYPDNHPYPSDDMSRNRQSLFDRREDAPARSLLNHSFNEPSSKSGYGYSTSRTRSPPRLSSSKPSSGYAERTRTSNYGDSSHLSSRYRELGRS